MRHLFHRTLFPLIAVLIPLAGQAVQWPLKVSDNGRYLTESDGTPFFFLCDTAWQLTGRIQDPEVKPHHTWATSLDQMRTYLDDCAAKGFTVIHCVLLKEFEDMSPEILKQPDDAFFDRCVEYVAYAYEKGLAINLIPAWMGFNGHKWAKVFEELSEEEVRAYARYVAGKFGDFPNVIYSMGGDCAAYVEKEGEVLVDIRDESRWMGETFKEADPDALCMYFSQGNVPSSRFFHDSPWCDFNFVEVKRPDSTRQYMDVVEDYHREPVKPTYLGEFAYEYEYEGQRWPPVSARIIRRSAHWNLLSGSFGYTYGRRGLWHFNHSAAGLGLNYKLYKPWEELLTCEKSPGRCHMALMAETIRSLPWHALVPNHYLPPERKLLTEGSDGLGSLDYVASAVTEDGSLALVYFPGRLEAKLNLQVLNGRRLEMTWKDPTGDWSETSPVTSDRLEPLTVQPPARPNASGDADWLLILKGVE